MKKINFYSDDFDEMKLQLSKSIDHVVQKIASGEFVSGDINLKLKIGLSLDFKEEKAYKKPVVIYKVGTTLQKKSNLDGGFEYINKELILDDDGEAILKDVVSAQMDMLEE